MKIYTKTGDKGETSLFTGQRVKKNAIFIDALGAVDECNSALGSAIAFLPEEESFKNLREVLILIQHALFDLGAAIATPRTKANKSKIDKTRFDEEEIQLLEQWIDKMTEELPPLHHFILPGGHRAGAALHLARSICRRAEREVIPLRSPAEVSENVLRYLNRLSDYLFVAARYVNYLAKCPEMKWKPHLTKN